MPEIQAVVDDQLDKVKLTPTEKRTLGATLVTKIKDLRKPGALKAGLMRAELAQYRPVSLTLLSTLGGGIAEPIRRSLVSRLVTPCAQQGLALIVVGGVAQMVARTSWLPFPVLGPVGAAQCAYGGALVAVSMYGTEENPDPVKIAIEGTGWKALHPAKKAADDSDES